MSKHTRPLLRKARTDIQRREDMINISKLMLQKRFTREEIAVKLGLTVVQVDYDIREIRQMWQEQVGHDIKEIYSKQLATLDLLEAEAWAMWELSKEKKELGAISYWRAIMQCWEQRNKIMGFAGDRVDINMNVNGNINHHAITDYSDYSDDELYREMERLDNQLVAFDAVGTPLIIDGEFTVAE